MEMRFCQLILAFPSFSAYDKKVIIIACNILKTSPEIHDDTNESNK